MTFSYRTGLRSALAFVLAAFVTAPAAAAGVNIGSLAAPVDVSGSLVQKVHGSHCRYVRGPSGFTYKRHNHSKACRRHYGDYDDDYYYAPRRTYRPVYRERPYYYGQRRRFRGNRGFRRPGRNRDIYGNPYTYRQNGVTVYRNGKTDNDLP